MNLRSIILLLILILLIDTILAEKLDLDYFEGNLKKIGNDWFLLANGDFSQLDLAPNDFLKSKNIILVPKTPIIVKGSLSDGVITTHIIYINDSAFELRDSSGTPLWQQDKQKGNYVIIAEKCIGCQLCISSCPTQAIEMIHGKAVIDADKCIDCGICENGNNNYNGCPTEAIKKLD